jgi:hypothetical protein
LYQGHELNLVTLLRQALLDGTNPANPYTYWGDIGHLDQRIVETADVALALWLSRERVFDRMTATERHQVISWLAQVDDKETYPDNWIIFPAMVEAVRLQLGYSISESSLEFRLAQVSAFYRHDGWYADGAGYEFDLYNAWMFNWHYLLLGWIDGKRRPDYYQTVRSRARSFLASFQYFFGANGSYPAWGRSLVYRFAVVSAFAVGYLLGLAPGSPGRLRRLGSGCLGYFNEHGLFSPEGDFASQGFHSHFPQAGEGYIAPGSPAWACHGLFALTLDPDDPFWTTTEAPLPVEHTDFELVLPGPGFVVAGRQSTGQVLLFNSRSGQESYSERDHYIAKYGKFVYSTHFPFNLLAVTGSYAPDAMISLTTDGRQFGHRMTTRQGGAAPGSIWSEFEEIISGQAQTIRVVILLWQDLQVRLAFLKPTLAVRAFEAPGALGSHGAAVVSRCSDPTAGWEYAEAEGRAMAIRRLWGYDGQCSSRPFLDYSNLNLAYPYAEQPLVYESQASSLPRCLGAASLVRPTSFNPAQEFAEIALIAKSETSFQVTLPNGEVAFVELGNNLPQSIMLNGVEIEGVGLRCIRVAPEARQVSGSGLTHVGGIATLSSPGMLKLSHEPNGEVRVITDVGVSLATGWLGEPMPRIEVLTLDGQWLEITEQRQSNDIPSELVRHWAQYQERQLVEFRLTR